MPIQKEIWINSIVEGLFADNTFAARSVNHSSFSDGKKVHVPGAGAAPSVTKKRATALQALTSLEGRTDTDLSYDLETYFAGPVLIENPESVELSYDKRESVLKGLKSGLADAVYTDLINNWVPTDGTKLATTGKTIPATAPSATGNRKAFTKEDVLAIRTQFDKWDMPQTGRCLLLDADMHGQLLANLTETQSNAFLACADASKGIVGKIYGFDVYMRSKVLTVTSKGGKKVGEPAATDCAAALAWCEDFVSRSLGTVMVNENSKDAIAFGDVLSATVRAGGSHTRTDKKGVVVIYQATVA